MAAPNFIHRISADRRSPDPSKQKIAFSEMGSLAVCALQKSASAHCLQWVKTGVFGSPDERPLYLQKRRQSGHSRTAASCQKRS